MGKAKPVSLHPLTFDEALTALLQVPHNETKTKKKRRTMSKKKAK